MRDLNSITPVKQDYDNWCWAAVMEMIIAYLSKDILVKYNIAAEVLNVPDCFDPENKGVCDLTESIAKACEFYGIEYQLVQYRSKLSKIESEIRSKNPVVATVRNLQNYRDHVILLTGCTDNSIEFIDPQTGTKNTGDYNNIYPGYKWVETYFIYGLFPDSRLQPINQTS